MPLTRVQNQEAFTHVITTVFDMAATEPLPLALERVGMREITDLVSMKEEALDELEYDSGTAQAPLVVAVPRHLRAFINLLQTFVLYRTTEGNPIGSLDDWRAVTYEAFADFRTSSAVVPGGAPSPRTVTASGSSTVTPVEVFRKGIKRDANAFSALKDMKQWDQYKRSTKAQARAQGVAEVLDPAFTPVLQDDKDLFEAKQQFMYAVFEKTLLTDFGKSVVRAHEKTGDAQAVFAAVMKYAEESTAATIDSSDLMTYITSARWGTWNGTAMSFILHWLDSVRKWESLVPDADHLTTNIKKTLLENAVHGNPELKTVKEHLQQSCALDKSKTASFDTYVTLLKSAATNYDAKQQPHGGSGRSKRAVYEHDFDFGAPTVEDSLDIDSPLDLVLANAHARGRNRNTARMPLSKWRMLSSDEQAVWDMLPDATKAR